MAHHNTVRVATDNVEYLEPQRVQDTLRRKRDESRSLNGLLEHAEEELQLSLEDDGENAFGIHNEVKPTEPVEPPETQVGNMRRVIGNISGSRALSRLGASDVTDFGGNRQPDLPELGESQQPVEKIVFDFVLQDLKGDDTQGAVATASISDGETSLDYHFTLETPGDNPLQSIERTWDEGKVVHAHSWWSRFVDCINTEGCGWNTVYACWEGSWTDFLWCMVRRCGRAVLECPKCASCDCGWWCRWDVGCCSD